jgi:hypothetical protein
MRRKNGFKRDDAGFFLGGENTEMSSHMNTLPLGLFLYIQHLATVPKCKDDITVSSPSQLFPLWDAIRARPPPANTAKVVFTQNLTNPNVADQLIALRPIIS